MINKYKYSIPQIKCNNDIATGFFITKDLVLTAKHTIFEHLNDSDIPIEIIYKGIEGNKHTVTAEPVYSSRKSINEMEIIALRLESPLNELNPLDCISFNFENSLETITFGYPAVRMNEGTIIKSNLINIMSDGKADLIVKDRIQSFKGCSGGPLIYGKYVIGVVNSETREDGVASRLDGILLKDYEFYLNELGLELVDKSLDIYKFEEKLLEVTTPSISLSFYDYEEVEFENEFLKLLSEEKTIYLQGKTKEEVLGYILFIIKTKGKDFLSKVSIINSIDEWKAAAYCTEGKILIPNFNAIEISIIPRNTNIIIYSEEDFTNNKVHLELQKRTLRNMSNKLSREIDDVIEANRLVDECNGLYSIFKRKVFDGRNGKPKWEGFNKKSLIPVLLTGSWKADSKDTEFIELFTNEPYGNYINHLMQITNGEDPFILHFNNGYNNSFKLANVEESWEILGDTISPEQLTLFKEKSLDVLTAIPSKYLLPFENHFHAEATTKKDEVYSVTLKRGVTRSLTALALRGHENGVDFQKYVDDVFTSLFSQISRVDQFLALTDFIDLIAEASPKIFIDFLEKEINKKESEVWHLFEKNGGSLFSRNYYTHILWGIEKMLCLEEHVVPAIKILVKLSEKNIEYKISNSPFNTLSHALLDWVHVINISIEEKIELVKYIVENSSVGWKLLESVLPSRAVRSVSNMVRMKYRSYKFVEDLQYQGQVFRSQRSYYEIAINNAKSDLSKWKLIFENALFFELGLEDLLIQKFRESVEREIPDKEIYILKEKLRDIIYRHRYFKDSDWAMEESHINRLEEMFDLLSYESNIYDYLYLFVNYELKDLYPIPFNKDLKTDWEREKKTLYNRQVEALKDILKRNSSDLWELISLTRLYKEDGNPGYTIGKILAREIDNLNLNFDLIDTLKEKGAYNILISYLSTMYMHHGFRVIKETLSIFTNDDALIIKVLKIPKINADLLLTLDEQKVEHVTVFWNTLTIDNEIEPDLLNGVWDKLLEYKNYNSLLKLASKYFKNDIEKNTIILEIILSNQEEIIINSFNSYMIIDVFKNLHEIVKIDKENEFYPKIYNLEWAYFELIIDYLQPKVLLHELKTNPRYLAHLIKLSYKSSKVDLVDKQVDKSSARQAINILRKFKFCPCVNSKGEVNEKELDVYVTVFLEEIEKSGHELIGREILGGCFANAPITTIFPCESVCSVFEKYFTEEMGLGFILEIKNSRGVYIISDGREEESLALKYENYYKKIRMRFDKVSRILFKLSEIYKNESRVGREEATYRLR